MPSAGRRADRLGRVEHEELAALLRALGHPIRIAIVCRLGQTDELSPSVFADAHAASLATASHHVRVLAAAGLVQLVRTDPRREPSSTSTCCRPGDEVWWPGCRKHQLSQAAPLAGDVIR
jgi:DNA-binding transcriptional ArsR family regulator